jgi:hypothetical protein
LEHLLQQPLDSEQLQQQPLDSEQQQKPLDSEQPQQQPSELEQVPANAESSRKRQLTELELEVATMAAFTYAVDLRRLRPSSRLRRS